MSGRAEYRQYLYPPGDPRIEDLKGLDAYGYREAAKRDAFTGALIRGWEPLYFQPFQGVTSDGNIIEDLYRLAPAQQGEEAPVQAMTAAGNNLLKSLPDEARERVCYPVDSAHWQTWANPEFMQHEDEPFYYRIQSPVVILELDHHCGVFLSNTEPKKFHVHSLVRTPNGNDYGRALLRQATTASASEGTKQMATQA